MLWRGNVCGDRIRRFHGNRANANPTQTHSFPPYPTAAETTGGRLPIAPLHRWSNIAGQKQYGSNRHESWSAGHWGAGRSLHGADSTSGVAHRVYGDSRNPPSQSVRPRQAGLWNPRPPSRAVFVSTATARPVGYLTGGTHCEHIEDTIRRISPHRACGSQRRQPWDRSRHSERSRGAGDVHSRSPADGRLAGDGQRAPPRPGPQYPAPSIFAADGTVILSFVPAQINMQGELQFTGSPLGVWEPYDEQTGHFTVVQVLVDKDGHLAGSLTIDGHPKVNADGMSFTDDGSLVTGHHPRSHRQGCQCHPAHQGHAGDRNQDAGRQPRLPGR